MIDFDKVTTRGGDHGESSLYNGERRRKDDLIFHALGDLDELSSHLGVVKALCREEKKEEDVVQVISEIQRKILVVGAQIATPKGAPLYEKVGSISKKDLEALEREEKRLLEKTPVEERFILPGKNLISAHTDVARTVCRRAERQIVSCIRDAFLGHLNLCQNYVNRLSDYLFLLARHFDQS